MPHCIRAAPQRLSFAHVDNQGRLSNRAGRVLLYVVRSSNEIEVTDTSLFVPGWVQTEHHGTYLV